MQQDQNDQNFEYTTDWFSRNIESWTRFIPEFENSIIDCVEIGSYEGRSAIWILENFCKHPASTLTCIDTWKDREVLNRFYRNIKRTKKFVNVLKGDVITHSVWTRRKRDFIYIDGDHEAANVLLDLTVSFHCLKIGGILIADDYKELPSHYHKMFRPPRFAIDRFIEVYKPYLHVIELETQAIIRKLADT